MHVVLPGSVLVALLAVTPAAAWKYVYDPLPTTTGIAGFPTAIAVDLHGDVFAGGNRYNNGGWGGEGKSALVVKIDGATGVEIWSIHGIDLTGGSRSELHGLTLDEQGNVLIHAYLDHEDGFTAVSALLDGKTGAVLWRELGEPPVVPGTGPLACTVTSRSLPGQRLPPIVTCRNPATNELVWERDLSGSPWPSYVGRITIDAAGDLLLTGTHSDGRFTPMVHVIKLAGATGDEQWRWRTLGYWFGLSGPQIGPDGDVFVTGTTPGPHGNDVLLARLRGHDGLQRWQWRIDGLSAPNTDDTGRLLMLDGGDGLVVAGAGSDDRRWVFSVLERSAVTGAEPPCGDGVVDPGEQCDDGNPDGADGCDPHCAPSGCGNGFRDHTEGCDDGNANALDGCDPTCHPEDGCADLDLRGRWGIAITCADGTIRVDTEIDIGGNDPAGPLGVTSESGCGTLEVNVLYPTPFRFTAPLCAVEEAPATLVRDADTFRFPATGTFRAEARLAPPLFLGPCIAATIATDQAFRGRLHTIPESYACVIEGSVVGAFVMADTAGDVCAPPTTLDCRFSMGRREAPPPVTPCEDDDPCTVDVVDARGRCWHVPIDISTPECTIPAPPPIEPCVGASESPRGRHLRARLVRLERRIAIASGSPAMRARLIRRRDRVADRLRALSAGRCEASTV